MGKKELQGEGIKELENFPRKMIIKKIDTEYDDITKDKRRWALISGMFVSSVSASVLISNVDFDDAVKLEIETLNSFDSLEKYLSLTTPEVWKIISNSVESFIANVQK